MENSDLEKNVVTIDIYTLLSILYPEIKQIFVMVSAVVEIPPPDSAEVTLYTGYVSLAQFLQ